MRNSRILVWDLPTRAFHWLLALCFAGAFATGGSGPLHGVHVALGYTMLGLVAFRLVWGLVGTRYARFRSFAFGPKSVLAYLRSLASRSPQRHVGHNPAGSWAIWALLSLVVLVAVAASWRELVRGPAGRDRTLLAVAAAAVAFVAFAKVLSPQYLLFLVPLVPLAGSAAASALLLLALGLTQVWARFPGPFLALTHLGPAIWAALARNLVLVALYAVLLRGLRASRTTSSP